MTRLLFALLFMIPLTVCAQAERHIPIISEVGPEAMTDDIKPVTAPFDMPQLRRNTFPDRQARLRLRGNGVQTKHIQKAIDNLANKGGGTVIIPKGKWTTGRIVLKSNVNLNIPEGATLVFSGNIADYQPVVFTRDEGIELYSSGACIYAHKAENIAVTGGGVITCEGVDSEIYTANTKWALDTEKMLSAMQPDERRFDGVSTNVVYLPKTFAPIECKDVLIEGVTLDRCLYWNIVPQYCENVIIRGVTVSSFGHGRTDGIDIESSRNVLVEYCSLDNGDDCFTIKSGRGVDGVRVNRPTENVVIRYCLAKRGMGGIVFGTETAGNINNVYLHDCVFNGTNQAFRFKTRRPRGGGARNVFIESVRADVEDAMFKCDMLGSHRWVGELADRLPAREITPYTPDFHSITIRDVIVGKCRWLVDAKALPERPLADVLMKNITARCENLAEMNDVEGFVIVNAAIETQNATLSVDGCKSVMLIGCSFDKPIEIRYGGERPSYNVKIIE